MTEPIKPLRVALLSYGMSGEVFHAPLLQAHSGFLVSKIVQRKNNTAGIHVPDVTIVKTKEEVFQDKDIDLVVVNTPNETHYSFTAEALTAGKHVVVEKPFTVTTAEADDLIALAEKQKRVLTVFQNRRWDGDFLTVQDVVKKGTLGKIAEFEAHYDRFRNYVEANTWKEEPKPGTGILYNLGSHMLDQTVVLFGMPSEVDARVGVQRPEGRVDDFYDIRLQYDGFHAIVKSSYLVKEQGPRYILHGVNGSFVKYGLDPQEQALKEKKIPGGPGWGKEPAEYFGKLNTVTEEKRIATIPGNYSAFYQNVYDAIRNGAALAVKPQESRNIIRLIEACMESSRLRTAVNI